MFADLHLHTNFSDGTYTPEELVAQAARNKLAAIALTDHDTVEGCERAAIACQAVSVDAPLARFNVEFSAYTVKR